MIRKTFRLLVRLGLLAGLGLALFKFVQGRRSADYGRPSSDWAPAPAPAVNPNLPRTPPDPPLVKPQMLEEVIQKKKADVDAPLAEPDSVPATAKAAGEPVVKKAPAKRPAAKKAPASSEPAAGGPVKKVAPKKAAAKEAPAPTEKAPVAEPAAAGPVKKITPKKAAAKKAAPAKKAPKPAME